jgi:hypothetical protein
MVLAALVLGSCLNPVSFDEGSLPTIKVDISGSITINDVAIFWLVNRTKTVNVERFTIDRKQLPNEAADEYFYPKNTDNKPAPGGSLASYHAPTDESYTVSVVYKDARDNTSGILGPYEVQFPRAADYRYYLYWTEAGDLVLVDENKMQELPPDPDENYPDPNPSSTDAQTLVVMNVTSDQDIDLVDFEKISSVNPTTHLLQDRPKAKDQGRILLGSGSYDTVVSYTRSGTQAKTSVKTTVITAESGSMAVRTNYLYFYRTLSGSYSISPVWPPIPNDAAPIDNLLDTLADNQGILEIINGAQGNDDLDYIHKVMIDGEEYVMDPVYPDAPYMVPGDKNQYILEEGMVYVSFKPRNNPYGTLIPRTIEAKKITQLVYTRGLANPDLPDPNSGIIRITNNSSAVVISVNVYNKSDIANPYPIDSDSFTPPYPIQYGKVGRVFVDGSEFPLDPGVNQIVEVVMDTADDLITLQRLVALKGQIVDIIIDESSLNPGGNENGSRPGSKVTVANTTISESHIAMLYVYNEADPASLMVYPLSVDRNGTDVLYVLSVPSLPIVSGETYKAKLVVSTQRGVGTIEKEFNPDGDLYSLTPDSHLRTVTLTEQDLIDNNLNEIFVPVTGIERIQEELTVYTKNGLVVSGSFSLNAYTMVQPPTATAKSISWSVNAASASYITVDVNNVLNVIKAEDDGVEKTVTLQAVIRNGKGVLGSKLDYTQNIEFKLKYVALDAPTPPPSSVPVTSIVLTPKLTEVEKGAAVNISDLAAVTFNPSSPHKDGVPITSADLVWTSSSGGAVTNNEKFTGTAAGMVTITATLPAAKNPNGVAITQTMTIMVKDPPPPPGPTMVTLRIIRNKEHTGSEYVSGVFIEAVTWDHPKRKSVGFSGYSEVQWAGNSSANVGITSKSAFTKYYANPVAGRPAPDPTSGINSPYYNWKGLYLKNLNDYVDLQIPVPRDGSPVKGYRVFFVEGDNRVRGYVNPPEMDPDLWQNYAFFLDARRLYNEARIPMIGAVEYTGGTMVIPIGYETWYNVASIMTSAGNGKRPKTNYRTEMQASDW